MNRESLTILGVDPGSSRIGYGVIIKNGTALSYVAAGVIEIAEKETGAKLLTLAREYEKLLEKYQPDFIGIEKLFFTKNVKTGIEVAQSRGLLVYFSTRYLISINSKLTTKNSLLEFTPQQIKQSVTNYGGADKRTVARMAALLLTIPQQKILDDATDALAVAICSASQL